MSRGNRACRRGCHEDATRKLLPWNFSITEQRRASRRVQTADGGQTDGQTALSARDVDVVHPPREDNHQATIDRRRGTAASDGLCGHDAEMRGAAGGGGGGTLSSSSTATSTVCWLIAISGALLSSAFVVAASTAVRHAARRHASPSSTVADLPWPTAIAGQSVRVAALSSSSLTID